MAYKIKWSPRAAFQFEDICNYIAKDSKYYASLFAKRVNAIVKVIPQFPEAGRIVPEYGNENLRERLYENYRIIYRLKRKFTFLKNCLSKHRRFQPKKVFVVTNDSRKDGHSRTSEVNMDLKIIL